MSPAQFPFFPLRITTPKQNEGRYLPKFVFTWSFSINDTISVNETDTYNLAHDICLKDMENSKTITAEGYNECVTVLGVNNGNYTESFNVTVYANSTLIGEQLPTLPSADSTTITFTWNTTGFAYGNYTLTAYAWPVPGETNLANNNCTGNWVVVTISGDVDGNGRVDMTDVMVALYNFGQHSP